MKPIEKATEKQISYIRAIEDATGKLFDYKNATKQSASKYISENIEEYKEIISTEEYAFEHYTDIWAITHGYF